MEYEETLRNLKIIEKEYNELFNSYNENIPSYVLDNLYYKLETVYYKYLLEGFKLLDNENQKYFLAKLKLFLTTLSYSLSVSSIFLVPNKPQFTLLALGSSFFLSFKRRYDNDKEKFLTPEMYNAFYELINNFDIKVDKTLNLISDRIDELNSDEYINSLSAEDANKKIASKTLMEILYKTQNNFEISEITRDEIINLLKENFNTNESNFEELLNMEFKEFDLIDIEHTKLENETSKYAKKRYTINK